MRMAGQVRKDENSLRGIKIVPGAGVPGLWKVWQNRPLSYYNYFGQMLSPDKLHECITLHA